MKNKILILVLLAATNCNSLFGNDCNCVVPLEQDLVSVFPGNNFSEIKAWLTEYFLAEVSERNKLKKDAKHDFTIDNIIDALPNNIKQVNNDLKFRPVLAQIEREVTISGFFSNQHFEEFFTSMLNLAQLPAYTKCQTACAGSDSSPVIQDVDVSNDNSIIYSISLKPDATQNQITLQNNLICDNCSLLSDNMLEAGLQIHKGETIIQPIIRIKEDADFSLHLTFTEIVVQPITEKPKMVSGDYSPIGTIIASNLPYDKFCKVNAVSTDFRYSPWMPCDGRLLPTDSPLFGEGELKTPDLRGVFLRGVNKMYEGVQPALTDEGQLNPDIKKAGEYQDDAFQGHGHNKVTGCVINSNVCGTYGHYAGQPNNSNEQSTITFPTDLPGWGKVKYAEETRPNNVSIFYYIKIR